MTFIKYIAGFFAFMAVAVVIAAGGVFVWGKAQFEASQFVEKPVLFEVKRGMGLGQVAHALADEGLIGEPMIFMAGARALKAQADIKAGEYEFKGELSPKRILELLREGKTYQRNFTVPEGLTSYEIVKLINGVPNLSGETADIPAEGTLLPETYDFRKMESRTEILERLRQSMVSTIFELCKINSKERSGDESVSDVVGENELGSEKASSAEPHFCPAYPDTILKDRNELITLASIIEKETGKPEERYTVAGVFVNRLKKGMRLQTDPTVIYAIHKGKPETEGKGPLGRRLLKKDLEYDSPYNTYKYAGLPPGPIANPGRASLKAALEPEDHDLIYFVADGTGGHLFARTLKEHNRNVANWRKIRREKKRTPAR